MKNKIFALFSSLFDTLGISGFATMTYWMKRTNMVSDYKIPATLNAYFCLPTILQAILFVTAIRVDLLTLIMLTVSSMIGSYFGVRYYKNINENCVRKVMSSGLFFVAIIILLGLIGIIPAGGYSNELLGFKLIIGCLGMFITNFLESIGVGSYAPSIALLYLLGMNPVSAFPIMMLSSAIDMPIIVYFYNKEGLVNWKNILPIIPFGVIGVILAFYIFLNINLSFLKIIIIFLLIHSSYLFYKDIK